jgi:hypothetical protein
MKDLFAYTFESDITLADMLLRLNNDGPWRWVARDSEHWGDYISTRALKDPDYAMVKLFVEPSHFAVNVKFESSRPDAQVWLDELQQALLTKVLPLIGARNVQPTNTDD